MNRREFLKALGFVSIAIEFRWIEKLLSLIPCKKTIPIDVVIRKWHEKHGLPQPVLFIPMWEKEK